MSLGNKEIQFILFMTYWRDDFLRKKTGKRGVFVYLFSTTFLIIEKK